MTEELDNQAGDQVAKNRGHLRSELSMVSLLYNCSVLRIRGLLMEFDNIIAELPGSRMPLPLHVGAMTCGRFRMWSAGLG